MAGPSNKQEIPKPDRDWFKDHRADAPSDRTISKIARFWRPLVTFMERPSATLARYTHRLIDRTSGKAFSADELATDENSPVKQAIDAAGGGLTASSSPDSGGVKVVQWTAGGYLQANRYLIPVSGGGSYAILGDPTGSSYQAKLPGASGTLALTTQSDGSITPSDITGTSTGGNAGSDSGKIVVFAANGGISASSSSTSGTAISGSTSGLIGVGIAASSSTAAGKALTATADNGGQAIQVGSTSTVHLAISGAGAVVISSTLAENFRTALGIPSYADETAANAGLNSGDIYFNEALGVLRAATA